MLCCHAKRLRANETLYADHTHAQCLPFIAERGEVSSATPRFWRFVSINRRSLAPRLSQGCCFVLCFHIGGLCTASSQVIHWPCLTAFFHSLTIPCVSYFTDNITRLFFLLGDFGHCWSAAPLTAVSVSNTLQFERWLGFSQHCIRKLSAASLSYIPQPRT